MTKDYRLLQDRVRARPGARERVERMKRASLAEVRRAAEVVTDAEDDEDDR